jgi:alpha-N-arabinofuranosidase
MKKTIQISTHASRIFMAAFVIVSAAMAQNTLTLNVAQARDTIRKTIYGALMEDWGRDIYGGIYVGANSTIPNTGGMRNDIIAGFKEIGVGVLQFPGGCKSEVYHWKDGVGNKAERPGGENVNGMGTDEYFQLCELVGSAPFIQVNCKEGSPAEMAAWLNYIHEKYPDRLKYLGMGNEPWGGCYTGITVKAYLDDWYDKFKAAIPPEFSGKIIRIAASGFNDENTTDFSWTDEVLRREVGSIEGLSWHYYTTKSWTEGAKGSSYQFTENEYYDILTRAFAMETIAKKVMAIMDRRDPDVTCGLQPDEWGAWYNQEPGMGLSFQQSTIRDAQITAQHLNFFNNNCRRIWMAQSAQPANAIHALFLTDPASGKMVKTPSFYVYKLFVPHHNALMVPVKLTCSKVNGLAALTASASVNDSNQLHVSISNIHATAEQPLTITLDGGSYRNVSGQMIKGSAITSHNTFTAAEQVNIQEFPASNYTLDGNTVKVTLPAHSVVMLKLKPRVTGITTHTGNAGALTRCSMRVLPGNRIMLHHQFISPTPITVSLFSVDGRSVAAPLRAVAGPGRNSLVWEPEVPYSGANTFIVTVEAGNVSIAQRILLVSQR